MRHPCRHFSNFSSKTRNYVLNEEQKKEIITVFKKRSISHRDVGLSANSFLDATDSVWSTKVKCFICYRLLTDPSIRNRYETSENIPLLKELFYLSSMFSRLRSVISSVCSDFLGEGQRNFCFTTVSARVLTFFSANILLIAHNRIYCSSLIIGYSF